MSKTLTSDATGVSQIGLQVLYGGSPNAGGAEAVTVEIAAVTIIQNTSGTPTPIPNYSWTFEDNGVDGFYKSYPAADGLGVTSYSSLGITAQETGNNYGLDLTVLSSAGNDFQVETNYVYVSGNNGFPINFNSLGAVGVRCEVYVMPDATGLSFYGAAPYVKTSGSIYSTGGVGGAVPGGYSYTNLSIGSWTEVQLLPAGSNWATDSFDVTAIGLEINEGGTGTQPAASDFIVDNVQVY